MSVTPRSTAEAAGTAINNSQIPKHEQLRTIILKLAREELEPGARLPSERTLMDSYGVSRITVRAAIGRLVNEGHLVRVPAKGTFVADSPVQSTLHLASFTAPEDTAVALGLAPGSEAVHLKRLRLADGRPVSVDDAWYNPEHAPGLLEIDLTGSVYKALAAQFGHQIDRARQSVRSEGAPADVGALLGTGTGAPVLAFDRVSYSGPLAIEHSRSWYRSDRYSLTMEVRL